MSNKKIQPKIYSKSPEPSMPDSPDTEFNYIINRLENQNSNLDTYLSGISSNVNKLHINYEKDDGGSVAEKTPEPRTVTEKLRSLLDWNRNLVDRARQINDHLNTVV